MAQSFSKNNLIAVVVVIFALFAGVAILRSDDKTQTTQPQENPSSSTLQVQGAATSSLEVREALGDPAPYPNNLQSTKTNTSQEAAGRLQRPQTADKLQPNAKTLEITEE